MNDVKSRRCASGSWLAVLGPELTLLLPGAQRARAAQLWAVLDDGAPFEVVLDKLLSDGLSSVEEFVLVAATGGAARVLVRGRASVTVRGATGPVEVSAGDRIWAEESFGDVESLVATLPGADVQGPELPAHTGLLQVGSMTWGVPADGSAPVAAAPRHASQPTAEPAIEPEPVPEPVAEPVPDPDPVTEPLYSQAPPTPPVPPVPPVKPPRVTVPEVDETGEHPAVQAAASFDHDGMTQYGAPKPPPPPSGIPGQTQAPQVTSRPVARLVFSHGTDAQVDRVILIGRAPEAGRLSPDDQPELIAVPSPHQEVSSTHLEIRPGSGVDHGMAIATDLGSTNGTLLVQPGLPPEELQPGIAVSLIPGAILDLGDGVTIQVTKP